MTYYEVTDADRELIRLAVEVMEKNFDRGTYYHVVGCALRCRNGKIYTGVNCDGIHGSCAEFVTIGTAYSAGERDLTLSWRPTRTLPTAYFRPAAIAGR